MKLYGKERKYQRQSEADQRQEERDERSDKEQLEVLDHRLGKGQGAVKERKRLNK